jgi:putative addiction module component (TIGR02574 family)
MNKSRLEELLKLPAAERVELAMALWDSLEPGEWNAALPLSDELRMELDRRLAEHDADPSSGVPWEVVRQRLFSGA